MQSVSYSAGEVELASVAERLMKHLPKRHLFIVIGGILGVWYFLDATMYAEWMRWVILTAWIPLMVWLFIACPAEWDEMREE